MKMIGLKNVIVSGVMSRIFYPLADMKVYSVQTYFLPALKLTLSI